MTRQIPIDEWPSSLSLDGLQLALDPQEITRRTKLKFVTDEDDLDEFLAAVIEFGEGKTFALQRYRNSPAKGTTVLFAPTWTGLRDVLRYLKVRPAEILWVAPELADQLPTARVRPLKVRGYVLHPGGPGGKAKARSTSRSKALRVRRSSPRQRKGSSSVA